MNSDFVVLLLQYFLIPEVWLFSLEGGGIDFICGIVPFVFAGFGGFNVQYHCGIIAMVC